MKFLLLIALCVGVWYFMTRVKDNAVVQQVQQAPEQYTKALQNDVARAKAAQEAATKAISQRAGEAQKEVEQGQ
jgi:hypothetical protein